MYDPSIISYDTLLEIFWHLHDPTTLNRQGNDVGTHYRSAIFSHNEEQKPSALASKEALETAGTYKKPVVTEIAPFSNFSPAEDYQRDYYDHNRSQPYCTFIIDPKVQKLLRDYRKELKEEYAR
jgi:peptide-methionine (S)-S-oxide reductase